MSDATVRRRGGGNQPKPAREPEKADWRFGGVREWQAEVSISQLLRTSIRLQTAFDRCFSAFGMTAQEAAVLLHCTAEGQISAGKLASAIGRDRGRVTRLVDRLEVGGFLSRTSHPRERRLSIIKPTNRGRRVAPQLKALFEEVRGQFFEGVLNIDIDRLEAVLAQLHANAERLCEQRSKRGART
jgi:DNA-binding MarR family transcriptional regulator